MTTIKITPIDLIDPNQHDLFWDIVEEINKFNTYEDESMTLKSDNEFLALLIDNTVITSAEDFEVLDRVKQINRERGLDLFSE